MSDDANPVSAQPLAAQIAMGADAEAAADARDYLRKQARLTDLQIENLQKQDEFETSHLRWRRFNDQMGGALQVLLVLVGLGIVIALGAVVWNAASDNGLVIEAFSVPPDLAQRGLTGEVVASKVLDRLIAFQKLTVSSRASASYANNWGDDIKVQIPNTGVSIGEFSRTLHQWLGHGTRITGDIYRTPTGIAISARIGGDSGAVFKGSEADLDALVEKAAEHVYRLTQPYRYAIYLNGRHRDAEKMAVLNGIMAEGDALERGWALIGMTTVTAANGDLAAGTALDRQAIQVDPDLALPRYNYMSDETSLQHDEEALAAARAALAAAAAGDSSMSPRPFAGIAPSARAISALLTGDYAAALAATRALGAMGDFSDSRENMRQQELAICGLLHDMGCVDAARALFTARTDPVTLLNRQGAEELAAIGLPYWTGFRKAALDLYQAMLHGPLPMPVFARLQAAAPAALAAAHDGDLATARRIIDTTPPDCVFCLRVRGQVEALAHNWSAAEAWFARAQAAAPSSPLVASDWGEMLLHKGDFDAAIAHFDLAHQKGPHFADPLEMWGEALIAKNRSDLALPKFEDAAHHAPNWGRLHLKWGEALAWLGRKDDARKQFALAAALYLTGAEQRELGGMNRLIGAHA